MYLFLSTGMPFVTHNMISSSRLLNFRLRVEGTAGIADAAAGSTEREMASSVAAAPIPTSFSKRFPERSSPVYASESKHKFVLLAKRVLIVLVYSVLLVVCLLLLLLYCVFIWPAKRSVFHV